MKKILVAAIMLITAVTFAQTTINWSGKKFVNSDFTVGQNENLVIAAGTKVLFADGVRIIVQGRIQSLGTELEPVFMVPIGENYWGGIEIDSTLENNQFSYTTFKAIDVPLGTGRGGLTFNQSSGSVSNCRFLSNNSQAGGAIKIISGNVTVTGSYFYMNGAPEGGAIFVENNSTSPSQVNITGCRFEHNDAWNRGGAIFIMDTQSSMNMDLNIVKCEMLENNSGDGGGVYYDNKGRIDLELAKTKILNNTAGWGSAIYMKFMEIQPGTILAQKFSNLLIFKNNGYYQSGVYINMGHTQNPQNINFTNATIAYNSILPSKGAKQDYTSGIYIKGPTGNFPQIRNTILWQNTDYVGENNYFIEGGINPNLLFQYCNIGNFLAEQPNISADPIFVRAPRNSIKDDFDIDRYDFHLSVLSPCANAGDPNEPCFELNSTRIDMGAYGNTMESVRPFTTTPVPGANTDVVVPNGNALVIDFEGKAVKATLKDLVLGSNSEIYFKSASLAEISFQKLTANAGKFDGGIARIHTLAETSATGQKGTPAQQIVFTESVNSVNTDFNDIKLVFNAPLGSITLNNAKFFTKDEIIPMPYALEVTAADTITIENSKFLDFAEVAIKIGNSGKSKATGRISNNTVRFDADVASKDKYGKAAKRVGIEISGLNMDVEDNDIEGGDEGIAMKAGSSGRISNNTVRFDADVASKGTNTKKAIVVSGNSAPSEISGNTFFSDDYDNTLDVIGIEIDNSATDIIGNKMYYGYSDSSKPRTGINIVSPADTLRIINNTLYGPFRAFGVSMGAWPVQVINNIYWSDDATYDTVDDTTKVSFFNNCFIDSTDITGSGNIFSDPKFGGDYSDGDFILASNSPCINAGMIVEGVHTGAYESKVIYYYGSAPDIGAEETSQEYAPPSNITTTVSATEITFSWNAVDSYSYYKVYASDDPYSGFTEVAHSSDRTYVASLTPAKKFFYIVATTEPPSKIYNPDIVERETVKSEEPELKKTVRKKLPQRRSSSN
jgi:hypothetical protein